LAVSFQNGTTVEAKSRGKIRYSNRPHERKQEFDPPEWAVNFGMFCDNLFDWLGYHEIPHFFRYAIILAIPLMPVWACFFIYCCVHNDEYEDEVEEMQFKERVNISHQRKLNRLKLAKEVKFD
jgi:hypothetical protein